MHLELVVEIGGSATGLIVYLVVQESLTGTTGVLWQSKPMADAKAALALSDQLKLNAAAGAELLYKRISNTPTDG